jgi:hypothetical protein
MIPRAVTGLLSALRFDGGRVDLPEFSQSEWKAALYYFDRNQLTLALRSKLNLPESIQKRLDKNLAENQQRIERMKTAFSSAEKVLTEANVEFVILKGFANWEQFSPDPASRIQYDLDLFCPTGAVEASRALMRLGYEATPGAEKFPTDHLPPLIRKTGWQWRDDFFDPEIPISIELHFRLWDESTEGFAAPGVEDFWRRRVPQRLDLVDALGFNALHLLRHLLRGDVRASDTYEMAYFLHKNSTNEAFWTRWLDLHSPELRRLQAICFRLAIEWFGCSLSPVAQTEVDLLPARIRRWFESSATAPIASFFRPNKDELWLHLCLLDSFRKKSAVVRRRLLPTRLPGPLDSVFIPDEKMTWRLRLRKQWQYSRYLAGRAFFHVRALAPTFSRMFRIRL